jgi:E3 ubiquitin-protein ligase HUWE1
MSLARTFGRSRNPPPAPETITHPLLLDASAQNRSHLGNQNRTLRNTQRFISNGAPPNILQALDQVFGDGSLQAIQHFVHQGAGFGGMFHIQLGTTLSQPRRFIPGSARQERTSRANSHRQGREFDPLVTIQRWAEEMRILHGDFVNERANKIANHLLVAMLPAALEAQNQAKLKAQEDAKRKEEEEKQRKEREAEEEAKKTMTAKEDTQHDVDGNVSDVAQESAVNSIAADLVTDQSSATEPVTENIQEEVVTEASLPQDAVMEETALSQPDQDTEMTDVTDSVPQVLATSSSQQGPPQSPSGTTTNREARITVMIHGSAVDITDTGIDPTFLEALPDDMREEVLNQHVRDQQAARVERPPDSLISAEFLDALPPDIRAEIIQQEAVERTRRRTEETARPPVREAAEIDPASFIASLDPSLRQAVLLDQDDTFLQTLPPHMIAEVDVYRDEVQARRGHNSRNPVRSIPTAPPVKKHTQHDAIMLLDRAGVAVLARLLFYPQVLRKSLLLKVLVNLCENLKTRMELFNLLLSILQDGTGDLTAVDKSFAQMTVKNRESKPQSLKGKQRATDFIPPLGMQNSQMEAVPDLIAQRCLEALTYIVNANESSSLFFLTEQEMSAGLRKLSSKKGKGKEKQISQTHYPLVLLLNLLDRQTLLRTPAILESVVGLLATITRPLTNLKEPSKVEDNVVQPALVAQDNVIMDDNQPNPSAPLPEATDTMSGTPRQPVGHSFIFSS